jgi:hypothetical protein
MPRGIIKIGMLRKDLGKANMIQTECTWSNGSGTTNALNEKEMQVYKFEPEIPQFCNEELRVEKG